MTKKFMQLRNKKNRGFTLIELIIVIAILAILAAILVPLVSGHLNDARTSAGNANARTIYTGATAYIAKLLSTNQSLTGKGIGPAGNTATMLTEYVGADIASKGTFDVDLTAGAATYGKVTKATWADNNGIVYTYTPNTASPSPAPAPGG